MMIPNLSACNSNFIIELPYQVSYRHESFFLKIDMQMKTSWFVKTS